MKSNNLTQSQNKQQTNSYFKRVSYFRLAGSTSSHLKLNQVDGNLCTHLILASARIDATGNISLFNTNNNNAELKNDIWAFKRAFPLVKVMISVSNDQEFQGFQKACLDGDRRQRLARSTIEFLQTYHLDGIDLDWEYPNFPTNFVNTREYERIGLIKICKQLREAIVGNFYNRQVAEQHQLTSSQQTLYQHTVTKESNPVSHVEPYLLSLVIGGQEAILKSGYDFKQLTNLCDWFNVKSYDYFLFKPYTPFTGPASPLYSLVEPYVPILSKLSFTWTLNKLLHEEAVPNDKIVMGIPTFARAYRLMFKNSQPAPFTLAVGARASSRSNSNQLIIDGPQISENNSSILTSEDFLLDYKEVCDILKRSDTVVEFDARARVPYLLTDDGYTWLSYENCQSVREKVRIILENNLAGYMTWNLNKDNFLLDMPSDSAKSNDVNQLNGTPASTLSDNFPLHRAMLEELSSFSKSKQ